MEPLSTTASHSTTSGNASNPEHTFRTGQRVTAAPRPAASWHALRVVGDARDLTVAVMAHVPYGTLGRKLCASRIPCLADALHEAPDSTRARNSMRSSQTRAVTGRLRLRAEHARTADMGG
jgi:hypothetical protein